MLIVGNTIAGSIITDFRFIDCSVYWFEYPQFKVAVYGFLVLKEVTSTLAAICSILLFTDSSWEVKPFNAVYSISITTFYLGTIFCSNEHRTNFSGIIVDAKEKIEKWWKNVKPRIHSGFVRIVQQGEG
jgi:uncharacterized membrane protein